MDPIPIKENTSIFSVSFNRMLMGKKLQTTLILIVTDDLTYSKIREFEKFEIHNVSKPWKFSKM